jgi:hypothetical protein
MKELDQMFNTAPNLLKAFWIIIQDIWDKILLVQEILRSNRLTNILMDKLIIWLVWGIKMILPIILCLRHLLRIRTRGLQLNQSSKSTSKKFLLSIIPPITWQWVTLTRMFTLCPSKSMIQSVTKTILPFSSNQGIARLKP